MRNCSLCRVIVLLSVVGAGPAFLTSAFPHHQLRRSRPKYSHQAIERTEASQVVTISCLLDLLTSPRTKQMGNLIASFSRPLPANPRSLALLKCRVPAPEKENSRPLPRSSLSLVPSKRAGRAPQDHPQGADRALSPPGSENSSFPQESPVTLLKGRGSFL